MAKRPTSCPACSLWRTQLDRVNTEVEQLREQLHRLGVKPEVVRDGHEAGYRPPWTA